LTVKCERCGKEFPNPRTYKTHFSLVHLPEDYETLAKEREKLIVELNELKTSTTPHQNLEEFKLEVNRRFEGMGKAIVEVANRLDQLQPQTQPTQNEERVEMKGGGWLDKLGGGQGIASLIAALSGKGGESETARFYMELGRRTMDEWIRTMGYIQRWQTRQILKHLGITPPEEAKHVAETKTEK